VHERSGRSKRLDHLRKRNQGVCRCRSPKEGLEEIVTTNVILISFHWPKGCWDFVRGKRHEGEDGENWIAEKDICTYFVFGNNGRRNRVRQH
jgi:hypothetical protein